MTASESSTVLLVFAPVHDAAGREDRDAVLHALAAHGFSTGPVVGGVCAVTGDEDRVQTLVDYVEVAKLDDGWAQARQAAVDSNADVQLLDLLRSAVSYAAFDEPVELTDSTSPSDHQGGTDDDPDPFFY